ncbi:MAG TPA: class I SAM-dependent methyltransferase, partial [Burkholderiales bacterium]|nr:class I SAM-dependent methyltransferase [Burkholderiales bacterium]
MAHGSEAPSSWVARWAALVRHGPVLDVASGAGRHARFFAERNLAVVAVDRKPQSIPNVKFVQADLE